MKKQYDIFFFTFLFCNSFLQAMIVTPNTQEMSVAEKIVLKVFFKQK